MNIRRSVFNRINFYIIDVHISFYNDVIKLRCRHCTFFRFQANFPTIIFFFIKNWKILLAAGTETAGCGGLFMERGGEGEGGTWRGLLFEMGSGWSSVSRAREGIWSPYIYVFYSPEKSFNPSAVSQNPLIFTAKVAEGFAFQTLQEGSAWHEADRWRRCTGRAGILPAVVKSISSDAALGEQASCLLKRQ